MKERSSTTKDVRLRLFSGLTTLLLIVAVAACLFFTLQSLSNGYVSVGGLSVFRVVTGSMEPTVPVGALLVASETDIEEIRVSDVVCFRSSRQSVGPAIITHRVIAVHESPDGRPLLQTRGDANPVADTEPVGEGQLIGRVIWHTGDGSTMADIIRFLTSDFGFLACIILPVLLIAAWIFRDAIKSIRQAITAAEKQLEEQQQPSATLSQTECEAIRRQVEEELRKELEQHAQQAEQSAEEPERQSEGADRQDADSAVASTDETTA